ncbi:nitrite/sulfite reductase [Candidatus Profftella armatura]|uniref:Sulfite reductase subunit beta n=1 Tax=Candidatus Profftella armatura TaxID=669502 RepID=S5R484_9PROT|nr:nitrite/sulfite reductase [Candidatus Profftella armatura]AGS07019.1 sulfite reductase subunit beta [Candidatus Profftella armatura]ALC96079.1 sulfite reductase [Candidatus Profftella armatura]
MYHYDKYDHQLVKERVIQYRDQVRRRLSNELSEEEFIVLRLQNGLYLQRYAYMLRIAIPYGMLSSKQMRMLSYIAKKYDRNYGHFTTRQNIQFNWIKLKESPDILENLASVEMHAIQTSGNCIRNITSDELSGVSFDEIIDTRPYAEILRQWSTFHPEFAYLPRKFKISISGSQEDRAAIFVHDIGLRAIKNKLGKIGFCVIVGGGMGRTPIIGQIICKFLPWKHILTYIEAILRIYNQYGRRDNIYKSRIKILLKSIGIENFQFQVNEEWKNIKNGPSTLTLEELKRVKKYFITPKYKTLPKNSIILKEKCKHNKEFENWVHQNTKEHKINGYIIVILSLKRINMAPGDITSEQMNFVANLADHYSFSELRVTHTQNIVLSDVTKDNLFNLWTEIKQYGLSESNINLLTDIICCPGGDFCSLANTKSLPIAKNIMKYFSKDDQRNIGKISLNISGCINSCGHHHIGNIGILGLNKNGNEYFQILIGGSQGNKLNFGKIIGPSFSADQVPDIINRILKVYLRYRIKNEYFINTVKRIGITLFKENVYKNI